jgi:hypothetical protein
MTQTRDPFVERKPVFRYAIALLAGAFIVASAPWLVAGIAAMPGLRLLIDGIRGAGLPLQYVFPLATHYLPELLLALGIGVAAFKLLHGYRAKLLAAMLLPWLAMLVRAYVDSCVDTDISCFGAHPFHEFAGILAVPLGLTFAGFLVGPPKPPAAHLG